MKLINEQIDWQSIERLKRIFISSIYIYLDQLKLFRKKICQKMYT